LHFSGFAIVSMRDRAFIGDGFSPPTSACALGRERLGRFSNAPADALGPLF
jgi:hypothetical protein